MDPKENFLCAITYDGPGYVPYPDEGLWELPLESVLGCVGSPMLGQALHKGDAVRRPYRFILYSAIKPSFTFTHATRVFANTRRNRDYPLDLPEYHEKE